MSRTPRLFGLLIILALVAAASPAEAKNGGRLSGRVKNVSGEGVFGAVITVFKPDVNGGSLSFTRSDKSGIYNLVNIVPGSYYLQVSREGYQPITNYNVKIDSGRTTGLDVVLQEFFGLISDDSDPRNWDLKTVMRSSSGRRLIFRDLPGMGNGTEEGSFYRGGSMNIISNASLSSENQTVAPISGRAGILSNFAFTEPVTEHARMIFSGQLNSGYDSFWRVRNTYDYRPDDSRDLRFSVGYGRLNQSRPSMGSLRRPDQFFTQDPMLRESAVQMLVLGFQGTNKFLNVMQLGYGFDYSRLYFGPTKSVFSPYMQVAVSPARSWVIRSSIASRRMTDENSITLPDREQLNLAEPTYITRIDNRLSLSQLRHSELAVVRSIGVDTSIELAGYQDQTDGPGMPFVVTVRKQQASSSQIAQLTEEQCRQHGLRFVLDRRIFDYLSGSIAYVYGSATALNAAGRPHSADELARNLISFMQHSFYHSITSQLHAQIPRTKTNLTTVVRWYPRNPISSLDLFADRMDVMTKGVAFSIRQVIPLPEFMGSAGRWEAQVDVRNVFEQGREHIRTTDGDIFLTRNPRMLRFGVNLNFF